MQDAVTSHVPYLPNKAVKASAFQNILISPLTTPGHFCLDSFLSRYLAGENSLRESRSISRKRLALVASGLPNMDAEAYNLYQQQQRYMQALTLLKSAATIDTSVLCQANKLLAPKHKLAGSVRTNQNWVGKSLKKASYIPPEPGKLNPLLINLSEFITDSTHDPLTKAYTAHSQLLLIHPFADGNGRTSRVLWQALISKSQRQPLHPVAYRLFNAKFDYIRATCSFGVDNSQGTEHPFWRESIEWGETFKIQLQDTLLQTQKQLQSKIALTPISSDAQQLLAYLWAQPVIYLPALSQAMKWTVTQCQQAVLELANKQVLTPRKVKVPAGEVIFDCQEILQCYIQLETQLFANSVEAA